MWGEVKQLYCRGDWFAFNQIRALYPYVIFHQVFSSTCFPLIIFLSHSLQLVGQSSLTKSESSFKMTKDKDRHPKTTESKSAHQSLFLMRVWEHRRPANHFEKFQPKLQPYEIEESFKNLKNENFVKFFEIYVLGVSLVKWVLLFKIIQ